MKRLQWWFDGANNSQLVARTWNKEKKIVAFEILE
jgi:hypothetical protein